MTRGSRWVRNSRACEAPNFTCNLAQSENVAMCPDAIEDFEKRRKAARDDKSKKRARGKQKESDEKPARKKRKRDEPRPLPELSISQRQLRNSST